MAARSPFGTAKLRAGGIEMDLAAARTETYAHPRALPTVAPGDIDRDLARRDFSINAMAVSLGTETWGELRDPFEGRRDLDRGVVRVLHEGSFIDDATRILRAVRYAGRMGFRLEAETERLLKRDLAQLGGIGGDRVRRELARVFSEERARGTDELLFTTHLTPFRIVIAKYAVTFAFVILMVAVSFIYPATAISRGGLGAQHLSAAFIGLMLHGIAVASIGLTCSAFTSSQLVASVTAWVIGFVWWDFDWMHPLSNESTAAILDALSLHPRYSGFAEGIVSLADIAYFIALVAVSMAVTRFSFDLRRIRP